MPNPFTTRATEHIPSIEGFLSVVTPDPLSQYFQKYAEDNRLFQKLVFVNGTPGSGKTTMARLLDFSTLATLVRGARNENYKTLISTLNKCSILRSGRIRIASCRIPLESDFQELWHLPYRETVRNDLLMRLIQARAVLSWFSQFERASIELEHVKVRVRDNFEELAEFFGGLEAPSIRSRAHEVEKSIYGLLGALVAPPEPEIEEQFSTPFRLFDGLVSIEIPPHRAQELFVEESLTPLIILDDAHCLHADQLRVLKQGLMKREVQIARWIFSRLDVLHPQELFEAISAEQIEAGSDIPGTTSGRDYVPIHLQSQNRKHARREFRSMAKKMGSKYIQLMESFRQNGIQDLQSILPETVDELGASYLSTLEKGVRSLAKKHKVGQERFEEYRVLVEEFAQKKGGLTQDVQLAMLKVILARYGNRIPKQELLFEEEGPDPSHPLKADADVFDAARVHLYHEFGRPFHVGIDAVCDAASENAEIFLQIAGYLVEVSEANILKQREAFLEARRQQRLLKEKADGIVADWNFPEHRSFMRIANVIGEKCLEITKRANAPLGDGANAFGIPNHEFETLGEKFPELARVLKFGVAYSAISVIPSYPCKNKLWCLFELGGPLIVHFGLTFKRGGFVEGTLQELEAELNE